MSMEGETPEQVSDEELLASVMADRSAGKPVDDEPVAAAPEPKVQQAEAEPAQVEPQAKDEANVPSHRLREEAEARRRADQEIVELRARLSAFEAMIPKPQPAAAPQRPELFDDPTGFIRHEVDPRFEQFQRQQMFNAKLIAEARYGEEVVKAASDAFDANLERMHPAERQRVMDSPNPFAEAVSWHKGFQVMTEVGSDPAAYRARIEAETRVKLAADPEFRKQTLDAMRAEAGNPAVPQARPSISTTSLSRVGTAGLQAKPDDEWDDEREAQRIAASRKKGR